MKVSNTDEAARPGIAINDYDWAFSAGFGEGRLSVAPSGNAAAMSNRSQPLRMPVQLMRTKAERAQSPATDGMTAHSRNSHGPSCGHSYAHAASIRAQRARRLLHFDRTARRLRNPWPVLAPDGSVIQQFPWHRSDHQTRRRSRAPYQQISSRDLHASPLRLLFYASFTIHGNQGSPPQPGDGGDNLRSRSSSCPHAAPAAGATWSVPRYRGCIR